MCKTKKVKFSLLKSSVVIGLLKDFPMCGVRYKSDGVHGLVLVHPAIKDQRLVKDKIAAARLRASKEVYVVDIPQSIADAAGILFIPTLTVVA